MPNKHIVLFFCFRTFKFDGLRVDEALRMYLETFRLPGEAPVIQRLIEAFSSYWSVSIYLINMHKSSVLPYQNCALA